MRNVWCFLSSTIKGYAGADIYSTQVYFELTNGQGALITFT